MTTRLLLLYILLIPAAGMAQMNTRESVFFSPDGKHFAATFNGNLNIGTINGRERKFTKAVNVLTESNEEFYDLLGFTRDSRRIVMFFKTSRLIKFLSLEGETLSSIPLKGDLMEVSPGLKFAIETPDRTNPAKVTLSRLTGEGAAPKFTLPPYTLAADFSKNEKLLSFLYEQKHLEDVNNTRRILKIMDTKTGKYLKQYVAKKLGPVLGGGGFSGDGRYMAYSEYDTVNLVDTSSWSIARFTPQEYTTIGSVTLSGNGRYIAVDCASLKVYAIPGFKPVAEKDFTSSGKWNMNDVKFSADSTFIGVLLCDLTKRGSCSLRFIDL